MKGKISKKPLQPAHMRSIWGGNRANSGRPRGTKKLLPGQTKLNLVGGILSAAMSPTTVENESPVAETENNEVDMNNGRECKPKMYFSPFYYLTKQYRFSGRLKP